MENGKHTTSRATQRVDQTLTVAAFLAVALALAPLLWVSPVAAGPEDWDYFLSQYESALQSVRQFGEFPWWNPTNAGGMPLAANPQIGIVSPIFALVLLGGTSFGLRLSAVLFILIFWIGMLTLLRRFGASPMAAVSGAMVASLHGAVVLMLAAGHLGVLALAFLPWILLSLDAARRQLWHALVAGGLLGLLLLTVLHYATMIVLAITGVAIMTWSWHERVRPRRWLTVILLVVGLGAVLGGWRIAAALEFAKEYPRSRFERYRIALSWSTLGQAFLDPTVGHATIATDVRLSGHEWGSFVGPGTIIVLCLSLRRGCHWGHGLLILGLMLAWGSRAWYHPTIWLEEWPPFSMMRVPTRWRLLALFGAAIVVATTLSRDPLFAGHWRQRWAAFLLSLPLLLYCHRHVAQDWTVSQDYTVSPTTSVPTDGRPVVLRQAPAVSGRQSNLWPASRAVWVVTEGYEPLMAHDEDPGPELVASWITSPAVAVAFNRSAHRWTLAGPPGTAVALPQNHGHYWHDSAGRPLAPSFRSVERDKPLVLTIPGEGTVSVAVYPPQAAKTWWPTVIGGLALAAAGLLLFVGRQRSIQRSTAYKPTSTRI